MKQILVEVYQQRMTQSQVSELFVEINRAEPVLPVDLPTTSHLINATAKEAGNDTGNDSPANRAEVRREAITDAVLALKLKFTPMFSDSQNCRIPHLNVDRLRNDLYESSISFDQATSAAAGADDLLDGLLNLNALLSSCPDSHWVSPSDSNVKIKALAKARHHGFFLGMAETSSWIPQLVEARKDKASKKS